MLPYYLKGQVCDMKNNWKKILALSLAAAVLLVGGLCAWHFGNRPGGAEDPIAPSVGPESPGPEPIRFAPPDPNPPPVQNYGPDPADFALDEATGIEYVSGIVVVLFEREASEAQRQAALAASGGEIAGRADMVGKWQLRIPTEGYAALLALCGRLSAMPGVAAAMPDHVVEAVPQALPSADPWTGGTAWADIDRLPEAWAAFNGLTETQAKLGMVDTGVNVSHEELVGIAYSLTTVDGFTAPAYSYAVTPSYHGTAVAGMMAARANNNRGAAGVAWNAAVCAVDYVSATFDGRTTEQVFYDGILAVVRQGAKAVNFSIGIITPSNQGTANVDAHGYAAAQNMWQVLSYGYDFLIVQSAGNRDIESIRNGFFCSVTEANAGLSAPQARMVLDRILVAGSLEPGGAGYVQADYSAYGGAQQIFAPGSGVTVPASASNSAYQTLTGTSMAAPQVTATAGWMLALNPALDCGQVGALLKLEAVSPASVQPRGGGQPYRKLDCMRALGAANGLRLEPLQPDITVNAGGCYILVPEKTTAAGLAAALRVVNGTLVYDKAQTPRLAGTGDRVRAAGVHGVDVTYTLVVRGDLNGDGRADALDAQCLLGLAAGTWQYGYSKAVFDLALGGMTAQELFDKGME